MHNLSPNYISGFKNDSQHAHPLCRFFLICGYMFQMLMHYFSAAMKQLLFMYSILVYVEIEIQVAKEQKVKIVWCEQRINHM